MHLFPYRPKNLPNPAGRSHWTKQTSILKRCRPCAAKWRRALGYGILSPIALLLLSAQADGTPNEDRMAGLGVIILLVVVALGLLFILPAAFQLEKYEYLEKEPIGLAYGVAGIVERKKQDFAPAYRHCMTQGVVLCVLAAVPLMAAAMLGASDFWVMAAVCLLLAIVAGAVQLFVRVGMTQGSFDKLLQTGDYSLREKQMNRRMGWFSGAYWCLVTAGYLAYSFWTDDWKKSWIIWAVAGLIFAALCSAVRAYIDWKDPPQ